MLALHSTCRYFLYREPVHINRGFYSLTAIVKDHMLLDPLTADVFIFLYRRCTQSSYYNGNVTDFASIINDWKKRLNNKKLLKSTMFYENGGEISANTVINRLKEATKSAKSN
ncbi:IS66 family insertion sequence element accessory protein TnpB [uncultured Chryseobacterium sp.]|jgi:IS66 Orf2 like protein.|uniref:IS66 family insertion sequence element accessory protein TnpB n=1 Tax=uncultured Chryseobacterium sp. TaxID=259322 RepID=UPI00260FA03C|nr:IS66 family insertion sequence element accessory protein TnpB [uncultured Chryseobacterium sp.]